MAKLFFHLGRYFMLMFSLFRTPEKFSVYYRLTLAEAVSMTGGSMFIVVIISTFIGGVTTLQTAYQLVSPWIQRSTIGAVVSASTFLELAPTVLTFILAGRVGSSIASQIGTMRVTEQIDAIEVMGINPSGYLILPKIVAALISFPLLITVAAFLGHWGGMMAGDLTGAVSAVDFTWGVQQWYDPLQIRVMYTKSFVFGFLIASISAYQGFYTEGGALEVGQSSTRAVVFSCLAMVIADYVIAQVLL